MLNSYLIQHKRLSIPGLGTIYVERSPAQTDFTNKQILPPGYHFRFDKYFDAPDREFFSFVAAHKEIPDYEAIKWFTEWAYEVRTKIRIDEPLAWEGVGIFRKELSGDVVFEPAQRTIPAYLHPAPAVRVVHNDAMHTMIVGDKEVTNVEMTEYLSEDTYREKSKWWVYALIAAAVISVALFFYFYKNGFTPSSVGNQQQIAPAN